MKPSNPRTDWRTARLGFIVRGAGLAALAAAWSACIDFGSVHDVRDRIADRPSGDAAVVDAARDASSEPNDSSASATDAAPASDALVLPEAGATSTDAGCAGVKAEGKRSPVYMLIVLDGSGSMSSSSKWTSAVLALTQFFSQVQSTNDTSFGLGMTVFEDQRTSSYGGNGAIQVPIRVVDAAHAQALSSRLTDTSPSGGTPTLATLQSAYPNLSAHAPQAPLQPNGKRVLVLISGSVPNGGTTEQTTVVNLVRQKASLTPAELAITTFAVGIGALPGSSGTYAPRFMAQVAVAGGTARRDCDPNHVSDDTRMCHFQLTPGPTSSQLTADFLAAIDAIRVLAASCEYSFTVPQGLQLDPNLVSVTFTQNGTETEVPKSTTDGWRYDNPLQPTKVFLVGGWCDRVKQATAGKVEVVLGCAPKVN